jgi:hypothetical protein
MVIVRSSFEDESVTPSKDITPLKAFYRGMTRFVCPGNTVDEYYATQ